MYLTQAWLVHTKVCLSDLKYTKSEWLDVMKYTLIKLYQFHRLCLSFFHL